MTAPSLIPGFDIGRLLARRGEGGGVSDSDKLAYLKNGNGVIDRSFAFGSTRPTEARNDEMELIYVSSCVEERNCMMLMRWLDMAEQTGLAWTFDQDRSKFAHFRHNLQKNFRGQAPDPTFLKFEPLSTPWATPLLDLLQDTPALWTFDWGSTAHM